jgi:hypothetical protein
MSCPHHHTHAPHDDASPRSLRFIPTPPLPDDDARERFAKRRAAISLADALAAAVGRSSREAGTSRLAATLAADAGVLRRAPADDDEPEPAGAPTTVITRSIGARQHQTVQ